MTSVRIEYFFVDKACHTPSQVIFQCPSSPVKISHVKDRLTALKIIDHNSHLRFLDSISGSKVWLDIQNENVPCPINKHQVVQVKIVQQMRVGDSIFMQDLFKGLHIDQSNYSKVLSGLRYNLFKGIDISKMQSSRDVIPEPESDEESSEDKESFDDEFNKPNRDSQDSQKNVDNNNAVEDPFDIHCGMSAVQNENPEVDFINNSNVLGTTTANDKQDSNSLGDLDILNMGMSNNNAHNKSKDLTK